MMEWIRPVLISALIIVCGIALFLLLRNRRGIVNSYTLGNDTSEKLGNSDEYLSKALINIFICNKSLESAVDNGYTSEKL